MKRTLVLHIRCTKAEKIAFREAARRSGVSLSAWLRGVMKKDLDPRLFALLRKTVGELLMEAKADSA